MVNADNKRVMTQTEKVEYILDRGCEFLGLTRSDLLEGGIKGRDLKWKRKRYLIPILTDYTILSPKEVAGILGYTQPTTCLIARETIKREISGELYGSKKIKLVYDELLTYLNLNNHENQETNQRKETVA